MKLHTVTSLDALSPNEHARASADAMAARAAARFEQAKHNPNQLANWYPAVVDANVRAPKTVLLPLSQHVSDLVMFEDPGRFTNDEQVKQLVKQIVAQFDTWDTSALFMKNSLFSAKHNWKDTCFITRVSDVAMQLMNMQYNWLCCSPDYATHVVLREIVPCTPGFYAFNAMPITQEYRLFVDPNGVFAYQFYWPALSIQAPDAADWEAKLAQWKTPSPDLLHEMTLMAEAVMKKLPEAYHVGWSVDFLIDNQGQPWLIDMALASQSYVSPDRVVLTERFAEQDRL